MVFLQKYGISNVLAVKIYNTYGSEIYSVMKENPYRLAEDVGGIGFKIADEIARKAGIHTDSDYRIRSGILYILLQASAEGTYLFARKHIVRKMYGFAGGTTGGYSASNCESYNG